AVAAHLTPALTQLTQLVPKLPLSDEDKEQLDDRVNEIVGAYADDYAEQYRALLASVRCRARSRAELRLIAMQLPASGSPVRAVRREIARNTTLTLPQDNAFAAPLAAVPEEFAPLRALAPPSGPATPLDGWIAVLRGLGATLDGHAPPTDKD